MIAPICSKPLRGIKSNELCTISVHFSHHLFLTTCIFLAPFQANRRRRAEKEIGAAAAVVVVMILLHTHTHRGVYLDVLEEDRRVVNARGSFLNCSSEWKAAIKTKESSHRAMNLMQITKVASHSPSCGASLINCLIRINAEKINCTTVTRIFLPMAK